MRCKQNWVLLKWGTAEQKPFAFSLPVPLLLTDPGDAWKCSSWERVKEDHLLLEAGQANLRKVPLPCGFELLTSRIFTLFSLGNEKWLTLRLAIFLCVRYPLRLLFAFLFHPFAEVLCSLKVLSLCVSHALWPSSQICHLSLEVVGVFFFKPNKLPHFYRMASECCVFILFPLQSC